MCTVLLPPGVNPVAVNKYIISYHILYHSILLILVLFRLRKARVRAEISIEFVVVTTFTYNKCVVIDFIYV
jgi:hypothetical protein